MKAIFVTGGGSGIGRATAVLFAQAGWRVGLADVDAARLATTAALLPADRTMTYRMDVRDRDAWARALAGFTALTGGTLDVLFNNAGIAAGARSRTLPTRRSIGWWRSTSPASPTARAPGTAI